MDKKKRLNEKADLKVKLMVALEEKDEFAIMILTTRFLNAGGTEEELLKLVEDK